MSVMTVAHIGLGFGAAGAPGAPSISAAEGTLSVTITIDGDTGVTNYLLYKASSDIVWTDGGSRAGDGDIEVVGLTAQVPYTFVVYSASGAGNSLPSPAVEVTLAADTDTGTELDDELTEGIDEALEESGELVTYKPGGTGARQIMAIVDRYPPRRQNKSGQWYTPMALIVVKNSSTEGISTTELDVGLDKISYPIRIGQSPRDSLISIRINEDGGGIELELS